MKRSHQGLCGTAIMVLLAGCGGEDSTTAPDLPDNPLQQVVYSEVRPPAISGGTLLVTRAGTWAVAADPDRDRVLVVDAQSLDVREIPLLAGDEPGRLLEDAAGRVHVALRRGGAVVAIDPATANVLSRREVCSAPRGMALSAPSDGAPSLVVACAGGELIEIDQEPNGAVLSRLELEPDLRDVVVTGTTRADRRLLVSTFRSPKVMRIGAEGEIENEATPVGYTTSLTSRTFSPTVAWRMVPDQAGGAIMMHQRSTTVTLDENVPPGASYYGGFDCNSGVVLAAATHFDASGARVTQEGRGGLGGALLPVDVAVSNGLMAYVGAGSDVVGATFVGDVDDVEGCDSSGFGFGSLGVTNEITLGPEPIAVAFRDLEAENPNVSTMELFVQLREPAMLVVLGADLSWRRQVELGGARRFDTGHRLFHANPDGIAVASCASCHPEGRDDGHVWKFKVGDRRTQNLSGGILDTAPFHWEGELGDMNDLMQTVFQERMGNLHQSDERVASLATWLDQVPRIPAKVLDAGAVARGKATFEREDVACATCHTGPAFTNNQNADVGTGELLQVPGLRGVRDRGPFMHDGCAPTLRARFDANGPCGGDAHGDVSMLTSQEIDDLVTYMSSL